ncbi:MAG: hypothetical protein HUJ95_05135 [Bacteroidales bacterium]|nr:hypothetical protein [Bacteroidales bacterium]
MKTQIARFILPVVFICLLSGCDFIRKVAGRPTSADLNKARENKIQLIAKERAKADSIAAEQQRLQAIADSIVAVQKADSAYIADNNVIIRGASTLGLDQFLPYPYYISLGIFRNKRNSAAKVSQVRKAGYEVTIGRNGYCDFILICGRETLHDVLEAYKEVVQQSFCPADKLIFESDK